MHFLHCCSATLLLFILRNTPIFEPNRTRPGGPIEKDTGMFANIVRLIRQWKSYNRSLTELSRLGDRELADIGISRSDIHRVAWNAAHH